MLRRLIVEFSSGSDIVSSTQRSFVDLKVELMRSIEDVILGFPRLSEVAFRPLSAEFYFFGAEDQEYLGETFPRLHDRGFLSF